MVSYNTVLYVIIVINCVCQFLNLNNFLIKHKMSKLLKYRNNDYYPYSDIYNCNYLNDSYDSNLYTDYVYHNVDNCYINPNYSRNYFLRNLF